jgi:hypothetical protein
MPGAVAAFLVALTVPRPSHLPTSLIRLPGPSGSGCGPEWPCSYAPFAHGRGSPALMVCPLRRGAVFFPSCAMLTAKHGSAI